MSKTGKPVTSFLPVDRRTFFTGALLAGGAAAAGAGLAARERHTATEPLLTDMTSNAPHYTGQPARRARAASAEIDPLTRALQG